MKRAVGTGPSSCSMIMPSLYSRGGRGSPAPTARARPPPVGAGGPSPHPVLAPVLLSLLPDLSRDSSQPRGAMNITVLTYLEKENAKAHDVVVDQVAEALRQGKHKVSVLGVHGDLTRLRTGLARRKPGL